MSDDLQKNIMAGLEKIRKGHKKADSDAKDSSLPSGARYIAIAKRSVYEECTQVIELLVQFSGDTMEKAQLLNEMLKQ